MCSRDRRGRGCVEWTSSGQELVAKKAKGVDVALRRQRFREELLRTHVCRRAHGHSALCDAYFAFVAVGDEARNAEVAHGGAFVFFVPQHIGGLYVTVDDSAPICRGEGGPPTTHGPLPALE